MFKELISFQLELEQFQDRITALTNEKTQLVAQGVSLESQYADMLASTDVGVKDQRAKQKELEDNTKQLDIIEKKIEVVSKKGYENLRKMLDDVHKGHDREIDRATNEFNDMVNNEARQHKAEYLKFFLSLYDKVAEIHQIRDMLLQAAQSIGCSKEFAGYRLRIPSVNLTSPYGAKDEMLGVTTEEIERAYRQGIVQEWVKLWVETDGQELLTNNVEARKRLEDLKKEQNNGK